MDIKSFILEHVEKHPRDIVAHTMNQLNVSRTTALRHIGHLVKNGKIIKSGKTRQIQYSLSNSLMRSLVAPINAEFDEYAFFTEHLEPALKPNVNNNTLSICDYALTEMMNNCKDHSHGKSMTVSLELTEQDVKCTIQDDGVGLFRTLEETLHLSDPQELILELSKGKLTRDPDNHTGEGVFFSSRAVDYFKICANRYCYEKDNRVDDWTLYKMEPISKGTTVELCISRKSKTNLVNLFKRYQGNGLGFVKTDVVVELSQFYGERLISRSQAQRVARNLEKFEHVTLDFKNIKAVGQGFVDQLFRVYHKQNPTIVIDYINANEDVKFMLERGISRSN